MRRLLVPLLTLVALLTAPAAVAFNPQPDPPGFERLLAEVRTLEDVNSRPLLATIFAAGDALGRGKPCTALNILGATRHQLEAQVGIDNPNIRPELDRVADAIALTPDGQDCN